MKKPTSCKMTAEGKRRFKNILPDSYIDDIRQWIDIAERWTLKHWKPNQSTIDVPLDPTLDGNPNVHRVRLQYSDFEFK